MTEGTTCLIDLLVELAVAAETSPPCGCDTVARQLLVQLTLQAGDERRRLVGPSTAGDSS